MDLAAQEARIVCEHCNQPIRHPVEMTGQTVPCPSCGEAVYLLAPKAHSRSPGERGVQIILLIGGIAFIAFLLATAYRDILWTPDRPAGGVAYSVYPPPEGAVALPAGAILPAKVPFGISDKKTREARGLYESVKPIIAQSFKAPSTAKFAPFSEIRVRYGCLAGWVDAQNSMGVPIRHHFWVDLEKTADWKSWRLEEGYVSAKGPIGLAAE